MLLSFHPLFAADENILCAGRSPDDRDLEALRRADAAVLPTGCKKDLYLAASRHCDLVFPDYAARFSHPGKIGQIRLFRNSGVRYPETLAFEDLEVYRWRWGPSSGRAPMEFPFVFKFDWGGEGKTVFRIEDDRQWHRALETAREFEETGQKGFLVQRFVDSLDKSLRCVVVGERIVSYWRVPKGGGGFHACLAAGAEIDRRSDRRLMRRAEGVLRRFSGDTGINLAGFDFLFEKDGREPVMLEINYFFGRRGLGGSAAFNALLAEEINRWLASAGRPERVEYGGL